MEDMPLEAEYTQAAIVVLIIENCSILANEAIGGQGGDAISGNSGNPGNPYGGGIYGSATISNSIVKGNRSFGSFLWGAGAGIYCTGILSVTNCLIAENIPTSCNCTTAAIYGNTAAVMTITSSSICLNQLNSFAGGGINNSGTATITNCIIWGNYDDLVNCSATYSCIEDNDSGTGNIHSDPLFVAGPLGNYYLSQTLAGQAQNSPCVDAGSDTAANLGLNDYTTRTDEFRDKGIVDMGYHYSIPLRSADIAQNLIVNFADYAVLAADWLECDSLHWLNGDIDRDEYVDGNDLGLLAECWLDCYVNPAYTPNPADNAAGITVKPVLTWNAGSGALHHDVYFATSFADVNNADTGSQVYRGRRDNTVWDSNNYDPSGLVALTAYYWRIDEVGPACTKKGDVWSFTTAPLPTQASNPSPANGVTNVSIIADLSWTAGLNANSHDVYFGTTNPPSFQRNQTATTFDPDTMDVNTTYYWRIDELGPGGTTTGTVWSFTTASDPVISRWKFDETSGTTAYDSAGTNNGAVHGAAWTTGQIGGALSFDGVNDHVIVGYKDSLEPQSLTLSFWGKLNNPSGSLQGGIAKGWIFGDATMYSYALDFHLGVGFACLTNTSDVSFNAQAAIADTDWHMWTMTAGNSSLSIYKDGVVQNTTGYTGTIDYTKSNNNFVIGARDNGLYSFNGKIDDVRFYNRVLSAPEIQQLFELGQGTKAYSPNPDTGAIKVALTAVLTWLPGKDANSHDVYFGSTNPPPFQLNQTAVTFDPGTLNVSTTYYWRIDEVGPGGTITGNLWSFTTAPLPGQASNPSPANGVSNISIAADLSWTAGSDTTSHDVYFGTVNPPAFQRNQTATTFDPGTMNINSTYYWRIDEIGPGGTTTGAVWNFTVLLGQAANPSPANGSTNVSITADLSWTAGINATSHDVYFGTVNPPAFQRNQAATTYDTGTMDVNTTYYWRIDEIGPGGGKTPGSAWSFTTSSIADPNFISWWKFDETSGTTAYDSAGTNNGTVYGAAWTTGKIGGALSFDGINDYVNLGDLDVIVGSNPFTIAGWVNPNLISGSNREILAKASGTNSNQNQVSIRLTSAGKFQGGFSNGSVTGNTITGASTIPLSTWSFLVFSWDGTTNPAGMKLYVNGALDATRQSTCSSIQNLNYPAFIGAYSNAGSPLNYFSGLIDDVRIYNRVLSASEILQLYQDGSP
jgi:hypothetical protein